MFLLEDKSCKVWVNFPPAELLIKESALWNSCECIPSFAFILSKVCPTTGFGIECFILIEILKLDCTVFPLLSKNILALVVFLFFFLSRAIYVLFSTWIVLVCKPPVCMQARFEWVQASQIITLCTVLIFLALFTIEMNLCLHGKPKWFATKDCQ